MNPIWCRLIKIKWKVKEQSRLYYFINCAAKNWQSYLSFMLLIIFILIFVRAFWNWNKFYVTIERCSCSLLNAAQRSTKYTQSETSARRHHLLAVSMQYKHETITSLRVKHIKMTEMCPSTTSGHRTSHQQRKKKKWVQWYFAIGLMRMFDASIFALCVRASVSPSLQSLPVALDGGECKCIRIIQHIR